MEHRRSEDAPDHHKQSNGLVLQEHLARKDDGQCHRPDQKTKRVCFFKMREEISHALPEIAVAALEPEKLRKLRGTEVERNTRFEPDQNRFRDKVDEHARADGPRNERYRADKQRCARSQRPETHRIAAGQFAQRCSNQQRNGRRHRHRRVSRTTENPEDQSGKEAAIQAGFGREAGEGGVADVGGDQVGREGDRGDGVGSKSSPAAGDRGLEARH